MALSYGAHIALFRLLLKEFPSSATDTVDHISHLMLESGAYMNMMVTWTFHDQEFSIHLNLLLAI